MNLNIYILFMNLFHLSFSYRTNDLYQQLFSKYNKHVRPVRNNSDVIDLKVTLKLIQITDVNEKDQIMQTHVYVLHEWKDCSLTWSPNDFNGIQFIDIPNDFIWLPDLVLYNNADGNYQIVSKTKARVRYDGTVYWNPPMIYKSYCSIDIEYYPFDIQNCTLKFGTWTFSKAYVNLQFLTDQSVVTESGWNLEDYTPSTEWEILNLRAIRHEIIYPCCVDIYIDLTFTCTIQRKTLFYIVNLIGPCINISFLIVAVFYLPSDSRRKITFSISILVTLLVYYLLLIELIPPTSFVLPLIGKYLLFTLLLVYLSIIFTIITLHIHFHRHLKLNNSFLRKLLFIYLPKVVFHKRPSLESSDLVYIKEKFGSINDKNLLNLLKLLAYYITDIADRIERIKNEKQIIEEQRFVTLIIDRILLISFVSICLIGTFGLLVDVPSLYNMK